MNHLDDDDIEGLLRKQFEGPVSDNGFSEHLMQRLPARQRRAVWPLWAGILTGIGACWSSLLPVPLLRVGWQDWVNGELSASGILLLSVAAGMALLACWWASVEAEDG